MPKTKTPSAVLISDIHFTLPTLELASQALLRAQFKAKMLDVPLIICGDTLDSKAIIRAEIANKLLVMLAVTDKTETYLMVGNHDLINEKGKQHSLHFLFGFANIIDAPTAVNLKGLRTMLVPYLTDSKELDSVVHDPDNDNVDVYILHQGLKGANMGAYAQDKTSLPPDTFDGKRIISGHYHAAQDIPLPGNGLWSYVGNPYTLSFGEAMDPPKGYAILYSDGSLERVPLDLRKHVIIDLNVGSHEPIPSPKPEDLVLVRMRGPESELKKLTRASIAKDLQLPSLNFRLELIPDKAEKVLAQPKNTPDNELMDTVIENMEETVEQKAALKGLWRALVS